MTSTQNETWIECVEEQGAANRRYARPAYLPCQSLFSICHHNTRIRNSVRMKARLSIHTESRWRYALNIEERLQNDLPRPNPGLCPPRPHTLWPALVCLNFAKMAPCLPLKTMMEKFVLSLACRAMRNQPFSILEVDFGCR